MSATTLITIYLGLIFLVAIASRRDKEGSDDFKAQYLANQSLGLVESMVSIVATEASALTFIGVPAYAYTKGFGFLYIYFGAIFGRIVIAKMMLPHFYAKGNTLYEIIANKKKSNPTTQRVLSLFYMISKILSIGVRLYAGSILVSEFFHVSIHSAILATMLLTWSYTMIGGLKAVVRTDVLQFIVFVAGGFFAHYYVVQVAEQPWGTLWETAVAAGKMDAFKSIKLITIGLIGGFTLDICTHGLDQDFAQRLMGCKTLKTAQWSIMISSFLSIFVGALFLGVGALLFSYYQQHPLPADFESDKIFAHFIVNYFPETIKALMLAGVLAATMSTLDSAINAVSSCLRNDIFQNRQLSFKKTVLDNTIIATLLLMVAFVAQNFDGILEIGLGIMTLIGGGILSIFIVQYYPYKTWKLELNGVIVSVIMVSNLLGYYFNKSIINGPWEFNISWGCGFGILAAILLSQINKRSPNHV